MSQEERATHFGDHAAAMGYQDDSEYLTGARSLLNAGANGQAEYYVRFNGDMIAVSPADGRVAIYNTQEDYIRTYFLPEDGYEYVLRQIDPQGWMRVFVD